MNPEHKTIFTWWRLITSVVVCACAIGTWWYNTHPRSPVKQVIVQVRQGDGYVNENQCRSIGHDKMKDVRKRFGVPAELDDNGYWNYPIRGDHHRHCVVQFEIDDNERYGPNSKVTSVDLELLPYAF